jgi:hypothetical protein
MIGAGRMEQPEDDLGAAGWEPSEEQVARLSGRAPSRRSTLADPGDAAGLGPGAFGTLITWTATPSTFA